MVRSMTGYGRSTFRVEGAAFEVEVRTVNHRHLDARIKLPRQLSDREADVRLRIQSALSRGKVDLTVSPAPGAASAPDVDVDLAVAAQYVAAASELRDRHDLAGELEVSTLLGLAGVARLQERGLALEALSAALSVAVDEALQAADEMRASEGAALDSEIRARLVTVSGLVDFLKERSGLVHVAVRDRLRKRTAQLELETGLLDEARLHQEIVIAADRLDVTEELVRLRSHVDQFNAILDEGGPGSSVGRRLEFLLQEMGRETNTVGSKANDAPLAHQVVEMKGELERIREQVLNIE